MRLTPHKARLYLLLGFFLLALPSINSFYHGSTGRLLVAPSGFDHPVFGQSVIYLTRHDLFGATGIILNKQGMGGPVGRGKAITHLSVTGRDVAYDGYAGWAPLQLNNEIWFGRWHVINAYPDILRAKPDQMWDRAIGKLNVSSEGIL
jgi:putative AlgH/UPF0301 family transcriptional regulator